MSGHFLPLPPGWHSAGLPASQAEADVRAEAAGGDLRARAAALREAHREAVLGGLLTLEERCAMGFAASSALRHAIIVERARRGIE